MSDKKNDEKEQLESFYGLYGLDAEEIKKEQVKKWKKDGLCPQCGQKGYFTNFAFMCTIHGVYTS